LSGLRGMAGTGIMAGMRLAGGMRMVAIPMGATLIRMRVFMAAILIMGVMPAVCSSGPAIMAGIARGFSAAAGSRGIMLMGFTGIRGLALAGRAGMDGRVVVMVARALVGQVVVLAEAARLGGGCRGARVGFMAGAARISARKAAGVGLAVAGAAGRRRGVGLARDGFCTKSRLFLTCACAVGF